MGKLGKIGTRSVSDIVFEEHPYALVLCDAEGAVLAHNRAAETMLGSGRLAPGTPGAMCEVVGCRTAEGPLEAACLHELAAAQAEPLPEVRADLEGEDGPGAAWVTAARISEDPVVILNELRPGVPGDRRRRTNPHWVSGARLRIISLGRTRLLGNEGPIEGRWISNRPGKILKLLVANRHRTVHTDEIGETLWPANSGARPEGLRYVVHVLRSSLEPGPRERGQSAFILNEPGGYTLNPASVEIDADEFEEHVAAGLAAMRHGDDETALARLVAGIELYGGDFLADEPYAEWALAERDRLYNLATDALRAIIEIKQRAGEVDEAVAYLERLTDLEPFDTGAHAQLLGMLIAHGRRSEAVRRYASLRHRMLATFGEDLDFTLAEVASGTAADDE